MQQKVQNELKPGRVLLISFQQYYNQLAILLALPSQLKRNSQYKVLLLSNAKPSCSLLHKDDHIWHQMMALSYPYRYVRKSNN